MWLGGTNYQMLTRPTDLFNILYKNNTVVKASLTGWSNKQTLRGYKTTALSNVKLNVRQ